MGNGGAIAVRFSIARADVRLTQGESPARKSALARATLILALPPLREKGFAARDSRLISGGGLG